jgi:hypothetical protein
MQTRWGWTTLRQKIIATVIALVLGSFAAVGAFASQDRLDFGAAGRLFSGPATSLQTPGVDTPTTTATAEATNTNTPEATETAEATETPEATESPEATKTAGAGCDDAEKDEAEQDGDSATGTPVAAATAAAGCNDEHENQGKHEGLECGKGHADDGNDDEGSGGTPTAPAATATPNTRGTPTIVAELPIHCHGAHGVEHDEGQHSGDNQSSGDQERD